MSCSGNCANGIAAKKAKGWQSIKNYNHIKPELI